MSEFAHNEKLTIFLVKRPPGMFSSRWYMYMYMTQKRATHTEALEINDAKEKRGTREWLEL